MTEIDHRTTLSVRGEAQRSVAPDQVTIHWSGSATGDSKSAAMVAVTALLGDVAAGLSALHGEVLTTDATRAPLTWSTQSIRTEREYSHNKVTGEHRPTGRHHASADSVVNVRDFVLLDDVEAVLSRNDPTDIHSLQWSVDHDNAAWAAVRADAIEAALLKGRDYATALRGTVMSVDHVADAGLLGGESPPSLRGAVRASAFAGTSDGGGGTSMTPVPQTITAVIEARLTGVIGPLPGN